MSWPRYEAYKPCGIDWIREMPAHWQVKRLKDLASCNDDVIGEDTPPDMELRYIDISSVSQTNGIETLHELTFEKAPSRARRRLKAGDTLLSTVRTYLKAISLVSSHHSDCIASTGFAVIRASNEVDPGFLNYQLQSEGFISTIVSLSVGVSYPAINASDVMRLPIALPDLLDQRAIATFLDRETTRLDGLIEKRRRMITLLQEKRAALITHAVTRGLDHDVPLKDSGVEWLGQIPAHWEVRRVKLAAKLESGHTPSKQVPAYWEDCDIPWVSLNDSKQLAAADFITDTAVQINHLGLANSSARLLPAGAVVFTRDATIGLSAITTRPMAVSQHLIAWIPGPDVTALYLLRVFNAMKLFLDAFTFGATIKTIGMPDVKKLVTPVPPLSEQEAITRHIEREVLKLDGLVKRVHQSISTLPPVPI